MQRRDSSVFDWVIPRKTVR